MIQKTNRNIPRRNKYILENILLNIFKFYILKYIIKFLQSLMIIIKKYSAFIISRNTCKKLAEHRLRTNALKEKHKTDTKHSGSVKSLERIRMLPVDYK